MIGKDGKMTPADPAATPEQVEELCSWPLFCVTYESVDEFFVRVERWFAEHGEIAGGRRLTGDVVIVQLWDYSKLGSPMGTEVVSLLAMRACEDMASARVWARRQIRKRWPKRFTKAERKKLHLGNFGPAGFTFKVQKVFKRKRKGGK